MNTPYKEVSLEEAFAQVIENDPLAVDVETCGFYGRIRLLQLYQAGWTHVLMVNNPNPMLIAAYLNKCHMVAHTAHYEITTIQAQTNTRWIPENWDDTFYSARLQYPSQQAFSLDDVYLYVLKRDPYLQQGIDKKVMQKSNWNVPTLTPEQKLYAATDVYYLLDVYEACKKQHDTTSYKLDQIITRECLDFQHNGMPVDNDRLQIQYEANLKKIKEYDMPINVNSYQQVRKYIDSDMSDDLGLATLAAAGNERAAAVRVVRGLIKQNSFMNKYDTPDGRVYGKFLPSTRSGRLASKDQNQQQHPRKLKGLFGYTPDDGRCIVYADYSQLELRCIAAITGETRMEELYRAGEDLHNYTAKMIFGENFTEDDRRISKTLNFNLLYGGSVDVFLQILLKQTGIKLSEQKARGYVQKWKNLWPNIVAWQNKAISMWRGGQLGSTPFGRQYLGKLMTDQMNIENQGFGAEVAKLALHYMKPELDALEDVQMINFIHDSYILDCPLDPATYERAAAIVADAMQTAWFEATKNVKIKDLPMPVNCFVGYNWGDIEKGDFFYEYQLGGMEHADV